MVYRNLSQRKSISAMASKVPIGTVGAGDNSKQHNLKQQTLNITEIARNVMQQLGSKYSPHKSHKTHSISSLEIQTVEDHVEIILVKREFVFAFNSPTGTSLYVQ